MMKKYVVGFLVNRASESVVLIVKNKPVWQKGKMNGVGGKIEEGETPHAAMSREFEEEAGMKIPEAYWTLTVVLTGADFQLNVFIAEDFEAGDARQMTDEQITTWPYRYLPELSVITNLHWLIRLSMAKDVKFPVLIEDICSKEEDHVSG